MKWRVVLALLVLPGLALPVGAGLFGKKPSKPSPAERVPELIAILRTDGDEDKRSNAAEELRQYDPTAFPTIIPALVEAMQTDKKPSVRSESAQSLGKLRPVSDQAGLALQQTLETDPSMRVRLQARSALMSYRWNNWHGVKKEPPSNNTKEPPLADKNVPPSPPGPPSPPPSPPPPVINTQRVPPRQFQGIPTNPNGRPSNGVSLQRPVPTTAEPPLAPPLPAKDLTPPLPAKDLTPLQPVPTGSPTPVPNKDQKGPDLPAQE
jgi:HEAT repeats